MLYDSTYLSNLIYGVITMNNKTIFQAEDIKILTEEEIIELRQKVAEDYFSKKRPPSRKLYLQILATEQELKSQQAELFQALERGAEKGDTIRSLIESGVIREDMLEGIGCSDGYEYCSCYYFIGTIQETIGYLKEVTDQLEATRDLKQLLEPLALQ